MNTHLKFLVIFFVLLLAVSCGGEKTTHTRLDFDFNLNLEKTKAFVRIQDSIPLFDSVHYYHITPYTKAIYDNKVLAYEMPNLNLFLLDTLGTPVRKITQKGDGLELLGSSKFAKAQIGESGKIYIMGTGPAYNLLIFSSEGDFKNRLDLSRIETDISLSPYSSVYIEEVSSNKILLTMVYWSSLYASKTRRLLENEYGIIQFEIDTESMKVLKTQRHLPYKEQSQIKKSLESGLFFSEFSMPFFSYHEGLFFVCYSFSNEIIVYDRVFKEVGRIPIKMLEDLQKPYFTTDIDRNPGDFFERTLINTRLLRENINLKNIDFKDSILMVQFPEVFPEGGYPLPQRKNIGIRSSLDYGYVQNIILKNLRTKEEKFLTFSQGHFDATIYDANSIWVEFVNQDFEEKYLLKYNIIW